MSGLTFLSFLAELFYEYYSLLMKLGDWGFNSPDIQTQVETMKSVSFMTLVNIKIILVEMDYFLCLSDN